MATHAAVVIVAAGKPLEIQQVPTPSPQENEVKVHIEWTASTPLDLHQADGGLLIQPPHIMGSSAAGTVIEIGSSVTLYKPGDRVFGYRWRKRTEKAHQIYSVAPENLWGKIPDGFTMQQAVVLPNNFVTVYHVLTSHFTFALPWPKPSNYKPPEANDLILIWGGSSSCGMYALQLLKYFGYKNVLTTASPTHHAKLESYGATRCFNYRDHDVVATISSYVSNQPTHQSIPFIFDCIGSLSSSVHPISRLAVHGTKVAILLPIIIKDPSPPTTDGTPAVAPEYTLDVNSHVSWSPGVEAAGVRTHFYTQNKFLEANLQSVIMPAVLAEGIVEPNEQIVVAGETLLGRAEKALDLLRGKKVSGGRLVWRVAEAGS